MYRDFLPPPLVAALLDVAGPVPGIPGLLVTPSLMEAFPDVESPEILEAVVEVARSLRPELGRILAQRTADRAFVDAHMAGDGDTDVIGERDGAGRIVIGPAEIRTQMKPVDVPPFMAGAHAPPF